MTLTVRASLVQSAGESSSSTTGQKSIEVVGSDKGVKVGGGQTVIVDKDAKLSAGKTVTIQAADQITFQTGSASITLKKNGTISIQGKDISIGGSGGIKVEASQNVVIKGTQILEN